MVSRIAGVKCLVPSDLFSEEFMAPMREGREVLLSARKPRSVRQLRFLFALLRVVVRNSEKWADEHVLLDDLKLATGLFETRVSAITGMPDPQGGGAPGRRDHRGLMGSLSEGERWPSSCGCDGIRMEGFGLAVWTPASRSNHHPCLSRLYAFTTESGEARWHYMDRAWPSPNRPPMGLW
jgi:hypothetical protein